MFLVIQAKLGEGRSKVKKGVFNKLLLIAFGVAAAIFLLEIGLRIAAFFYCKTSFSKEVVYKNNKSSPVILCVGDSFTAGLGAPPGKDYPSRLKNILQKNNLDKGITVINRGVIAQNTYELLCKLPADIYSTKPDIIVILSGLNNTWKFYGYEESNNVFFYYDIFQKSKVCKLLSFLTFKIKNTINNYFSKQDSNKESCVLFNASKAKDGGIIPNGALSSLNSSEHIENSNYKWCKEEKGNSFTDELAEPVYCKKLGNYYSQKKDYELAVKNLYKSLKSNLKNGKIYNKLGHIYTYHISDYDKALQAYTDGISADKNFFYNYDDLARIYYDHGEYKQSLEIIMKAGKKYKSMRRIPSILKQIYMQHQDDDQIKELINKHYNKNSIISNYLKLLEKQSKEKETFLNWCKKNFEKIIALCHDENIRLIFQTYPAESGDINRVIELIAREYDIPLVNNFEIFNKLHSETENIDSYFIEDGHCSALGYELMAENVYETLKKYGYLKN
ncbi:MAG: hypothetical protein HY810_01475 [Candidatus Omnitrophica bacterium]|nr:hypothetical protein [Candidatus Omnitrophota bacterium]